MLDFERRRVLVGIAVVVVLGFALLGFDVTGAQPTQASEFEEEAEIQLLPGESVVGEVTVENPFALSREAEPQGYGACLYTPGRRRANVRDDSPSNLVLSGGASRTFELTVGAAAFYNLDSEPEEVYEGLRGRETVPVERAEECPEESDEVKLVVVENGDGLPVRR